MSTYNLSTIHALETYNYEEIPSEKTIRILTLSPGSPGTRLEGTLELAYLDENLEYEAISYVWGDPARGEEILIGGKSLRLTQSIYDALQRMRHETEPRRLWADQICINQDDVIERGHQVKSMGFIYKNTKKVLVWLGSETEFHDAERVFTKFAALRAIFEDEIERGRFTEAQKEGPGNFDGDEVSWRSLRKFYGLPWFNRVWIGQEAGAGAPIELFWGEIVLDWETVLYVSMSLRYLRPLRVYYTLLTPHAINLNRRFVPPQDTDQRFHPCRESFVYELHRTRRMDASDPRDRVFARLGHYSAAVLFESSPPFEADYTWSAADVYTDIAIRTLKGYPTLELLNCVQHYADHGSLPAWVPDWGAGSGRHLIGRRDSIHRAAGESTPSFTIQDTSKCLKINGLEIDLVISASQKLRRKDFDIHRRDNHVALNLWNEICGKHTFNLKDRYVNGDSCVLAFCQALTTGCSKIVDKENWHQEYHSVPSSTWLRYGAAYLTHAFGEMGLVDKDILDVGAGGDAFAWIESASRPCYERSFFCTASGYYGLGPCEMEKGDIVVVLFGGTTPYILRPNATGYALLGECYVYGLMNGEAMTMVRNGELKEKTFVIQ